MLRTMSSLYVPNFDSAPLSMPKLGPIIHFPQVDPTCYLSFPKTSGRQLRITQLQDITIKDLGWAR